MAETGEKGYTGGFYESGRIRLRWRDGSDHGMESFEFKPSFFIPRHATDRKISKRELVRRSEGYRTEGDYYRVYASSLKHRKSLSSWLERAGIRCLEADVRPLRRLLADRNLEFCVSPRILFFDLETDDTLPFTRKGEMRILSVAWLPSEGQGGWIVTEDQDATAEKALLQRFFRVVREYDIALAWNLDQFDLPVIEARCELHGLELPLEINWLDHLTLFRKYYGRGDSGVRESMALDNVASRLLGKKKGTLNQGTLDAWENDREALRRYNEIDVELMRGIDERTRFIAGHLALCRLCRTFPDSRSLWTAELVDGYLLREAVQRKIHFPSKGFAELEGQETGTIQGAFVLEPKPGLYRGVRVLDYASLYPTVIRSFNISPETCGRGERRLRVPNGTEFGQDTVGLIPGAIGQLLDRRSELKTAATEARDKIEREAYEHQANAHKILANALYGSMASPYSRYYKREAGEAVSTTARALIERSVEWAKDKGIEIVASDTDSLFVRGLRDVDVPGFLDRIEKMSREFFSQHGANVVEGMAPRMKDEGEFSRLLFVAKKRYAGLRNGKMEVKGLECVRSDWPAFLRHLQEEIVEMSLRGASAEKAISKIEEARREIMEGVVSIQDLVISKAIQKPLDDYKSPPPHVRVALEMANRGERVWVGQKIQYVAIENGSPPVFESAERAEHYAASWYWKKMIWPPILRVCEVVWDGEEFEGLERAFDLSQLPLFGGGMEGMKKEGKVGENEKKRSPKIPRPGRLVLREGDDLEGLGDILGRHPGNDEVLLEVHLRDATVILEPESRYEVSPEMIKAAERHLGRRSWFSSTGK